LGITVASLGLGWVGERAFVHALTQIFPTLAYEGPGGLHWIATGLSFLAITVLHVVLGELVPKTIAVQNAEKVTLLISPLLSLFHIFTKPLHHTFTFLAALILRVIGVRDLGEPALTENELKLVMEDSKEEGIISDSEAQIITRAFEFADKRVSDIMVPKDKVQIISLALPLEQNLATVRTRMHTRFPLVENDFQIIVGIIHMKDVWPQLLKQRLMSNHPPAKPGAFKM
jgi:CBS domain containing-hemolysin-like protein